MTTRYVQCPTCDKTVAWRAEEKWRPFCSERCRLIDLGAWADESYRIPTHERPDFDTNGADKSQS